MHWDLVLFNPVDKKNHESPEWRKRAWRPAMEAPNPVHESLFDDLGIEAVTTDGPTPGWFLLRGYSFGSSTSDMLLLAIKKHIQQGNNTSDEDEIVAAADPILKYLYENSTTRVREAEDGWGQEEVAGDNTEDGIPDDTGVPESVAPDEGGEEQEYGITDALLDADTHSEEYIKLKIKQLLPLPVASMDVEIFIEHINLPVEIDDEVRQNT
jgi:hypothetical protein